MIKKRFLSMLVLLMAAATGAWADGERTSHWPDFSPENYEKSNTLVAGIMIDGTTITSDYEDWDKLEVAPFVGDECRCVNGESGNYLYNGYVQEYGDPFPVLDGMLIFYNGEGGDEVTFKMYNHATGVEYTACAVTYQGDPITIKTGDEHKEGWDDPENPVFLNFTSPEPAEPTGYTVSMKESTEDAAKWQGKAGDGTYQQLPLEGVAQGAQVSLKYGGALKVKSVKAKKKTQTKTLAEATAEDIGKIAGADGKIYATKADAEAVATGNAVAMIAYVGKASDCTTGLAIALEDVSSSAYAWAAAAGAVTTWASGKTAPTIGTWRLPSTKDWQYMLIGCGASGSYSNNPSPMSYSGLASKLTTAQGDALQTAVYYWSSTEFEPGNYAWYVNFNGSNGNAEFPIDFESKGALVRACFAF